MNRYGNRYLFPCSRFKKKNQFEFRFFFITEFFAKNNVPLILLYNYDKKIKESLPDLNKWSFLIIEVSKHSALKRWRKSCVENTAWNKNESRNILQEFSLTSIEWVSKPDGMRISSYQTAGPVEVSGHLLIEVVFIFVT